MSANFMDLAKLPGLGLSATPPIEPPWGRPAALRLLAGIQPGPQVGSRRVALCPPRGLTSLRAVRRKMAASPGLVSASHDGPLGGPLGRVQPPFPG